MRQNRILLMVDGANFFFLQRKQGWQIDPAKLRKYVEQWGNIIDAYYYLSVMADEKDDKQEGYRKALYFMGYSVKPVVVKQINTMDGGIKEKANADIRIALDAYMAVDTYDMFVLVSGDGDFAYLLDVLKMKGKQIKVISGAHMVARELIELAGTNFVDFKDIREETEKE